MADNGGEFVIVSYRCGRRTNSSCLSSGKYNCEIQLNQLRKIILVVVAWSLER
jgi:hypothetical protein